MSYVDYYALLEVSRDATQDEINKSYRRLARKYHPDVNPGDDTEARFKQLSEAYEVLKDPEKRALYDQYGPAWQAVSEGRAAPPGSENAYHDFSAAGFDPSQLGDLGALFEQMFGGAGHGGTWNVRSRGADVQSVIQLSVEDAFTGGERLLSFAVEGGRPKQLRVAIPAGIRNGQQIRLAGQGQPGAHGLPPGDLYLKVEIVASGRFELEGDDAIVTLWLTPWEAALGTTVPLRTLDSEVRLKIPAGSSSSKRVRLRGKGYPRARGGRGDLYVKLQVAIPEQLTPEERRLFEQLAAASQFSPPGRETRTRTAA